jgi:lambda family phage tail tape measure protein
VTGESIDKSVAKILELGQKPADTIASLNEQYHFLTASQYAQIAALEAEGKVREASRMANQLDAQAMADRAKDVEDNAGWMIRAGHSVAEAWGKAWVAMKGVGRTKDLGEQVKAVQDQINRMTGAVGAGQVDKRVNKPDSPEIRALRAQLEALRHQQAVAGFAASQSALDAGRNADAIAAQRAGAAFDSPEIKRNNEIARANKIMVDALAGAVTPEQREQYRTRYANQVTAANQAYESAINKGVPKQRSGSKSDPFASLNSLVQGAQVKDNAFGEAGQTSQITSILAIVDAGAKLIASGQDIATVQAKVAVGVAAVNDLYAKQAAQIKSQNVVALDQYREAVNNKLAADKMQLDNQVARIGMGQQEYERQAQLNKVYQDYARVIENLQKQRAQKGANTALIDGQIAAQSDARDIAVAQTVASFDEIDKAQGDWLLGAQSAYKDYLASASDVAGQSASLFASAFDGMSNSLANFVTTGKGNFKGLATSIIGDLAKMELRVAESKILQSILSAFMGGTVDNSAAGAGSVSAGLGDG